MEIKNENLLLAAKDGKLEDLKSILSLPNCNVNILNDRKQSALFLAAKGGYGEVVLALVSTPVWLNLKRKLR
jgi:hypothetical protein